MFKSTAQLLKQKLRTERLVHSLVPQFKVGLIVCLLACLAFQAAQACPAVHGWFVCFFLCLLGKNRCTAARHALTVV